VLCASDTLQAQNGKGSTGPGACRTGHPDVNAFDSPSPNVILNYIDLGAAILKLIMAESWGPEYVLFETLTS